MALIKKFSKHIEAGIDEAGRGCLAGPVVAAAVILPDDIDFPDLNDSKKLNVKTRNALRIEIEKFALAWAVKMISPAEIDKTNILKATFSAMDEAVNALETQPEFLIIDGNRFKSTNTIPFKCIVGGDAKYQSIAAASILAKTHRDELMMNLHKKHPQYGWDKNKGYGTIFHRRAIIELGLCEQHRHSFRLKEQQLSLF
jgi:ribonuclease HII